MFGMKDNPNQILIEKQKHVTNYYSARTNEEIYSAHLFIFNMYKDDGVFPTEFSSYFGNSLERYEKASETIIELQRDLKKTDSLITEDLINQSISEYRSLCNSYEDIVRYINEIKNVTDKQDGKLAYHFLTGNENVDLCFVQLTDISKE